MMYKFLLISLTLLPASTSIAQSEINSYNFQKGEMLDLLVISKNPDKDDEVKDYYKDVVSLGKEMSYQPLPGYNILSHTAGNIKPNLLLFGKWDNKEIRTSFTEIIEKKVPDFHQRRRSIFSYFGLTYYEIKENLTFEIDNRKFNVATALWKNTKGKQLDKKEWHQSITVSAGKIVLKLEDGTSPFGYLYQPDLFYITSWDSEEAFKEFQAKNADSLKENIIHINQFILD